MLHSWNRENQLKIMLLQLRKLRQPGSQLKLKVEGDLLRKQTRRTERRERAAANVEQQLAYSVQSSGWIAVPRARLAVTLHFFPAVSQPPELHNLVKFYLDPLKSLAFQDDRQIHYVAAQSWRLPRHFDSQSLINRESSVFITLERFVDYRRRFDLFFNLLQIDDFRYGMRLDSPLRLLFDKDNQWDEDFDELLNNFLLSSVEMMRLESSSERAIVSDETMALLNLMRTDYLKEQVRASQERLLAMNKIDDLDRPSGPRTSHMRKDFAKIRDLHPWSIDLGDLPRMGESSGYRERLRTRLHDFKERQLSVFRRVVVPIELDIQVTPRSFRLGKDLDNIMRDIAPVFNDEVLQQDSFLRGFRIYVTDLIADEDSPGSIRLKLLPPGAISQFEDNQEELFGAAETWLEDQVAL